MFDGCVSRLLGRAANSGQDALAFPFRDHVTRDDVTNDSRHERIAARFGNEPAPPLQLVERGMQRIARE